MIRYAICIFFAAGITGLAHADPHEVFDTFSTPGDASHIQISDCGDGTPCGTVIWINPETLPPGETQTTARGQNGELVLGQTILKEFSRKSKDWRGGTVYDPENDKRYAARLKRMTNGNLQLKGCVGPICQTQVWKKVTSQSAKHLTPTHNDSKG